MKKLNTSLFIILICFFKTYAQTFPVLDFEIPLCYINKGVKQITEKTTTKWKTEYNFNIDGLLIEQRNYFKNELRAKYIFNYSFIGDSLLYIQQYDDLKKNEGNVNCFFYYNIKDHEYKKLEYYSDKSLNKEKPFVIGTAFKYKNSLLQSYIRNKDTIKYIYNDKNKVIERRISSPKTDSTPASITIRNYYYDKFDRLTDIIETNELINASVDSSNSYLSIPTVNEKERNKYHIHYSDFDINNNWKKSYYITNKKKQLYSKRSIIYY